MKDFDLSKIKVEKIYKKEGVFETEDGRGIPYSNYYIEFTIGDYPLVFKAKIDKVLKDYIEVAYAENRG